MDNSQTFLPTIEKPNGLMMKLVYYFTKKKFGKVMTPVKIVSARMPLAFGIWGSKMYQLDNKLVLPKEMIFLIRHQVSRINICEFCMDIGRYSALKELVNEEKINSIDDYFKSPLYSDAEKAALDYVTELTRDKKVNPQTFSKMASHYSEREICEIVYLVASEHMSNLTNIGLNIHSDMFCDISKRKH
jgi:alkylhydroperoxidase family enzyme